MNCPKCGKTMPEGKKFCASCGTSIAGKKSNKALLAVGCVLLVIGVVISFLIAFLLNNSNFALE